MSLPMYRAVIPSTRPDRGLSRMIFVIECRSRICTPALRALSSSLLTSPDPFRPRWGAIT